MKKVIIIGTVMMMALAILVISISRASLEIMARENSEDKLRIEPVMVDDQVIYKLPEVKMLPNNMFYGLKEIRDWLWLNFSFGDSRKARTELLIADKKMTETRLLIDKGEYTRALESGSKAVDKLKYAKTVSQNINSPIEREELRNQIRDATRAYEIVTKEMANGFEVDSVKYSQLTQKINDFKEEQKAEGLEF